MPFAAPIRCTSTAEQPREDAGDREQCSRRAQAGRPDVQVGPDLHGQGAHQESRQDSQGGHRDGLQQRAARTGRLCGSHGDPAPARGALSTAAGVPWVVLEVVLEVELDVALNGVRGVGPAVVAPPVPDASVVGSP